MGKHESWFPHSNNGKTNIVLSLKHPVFRKSVREIICAEPNFYVVGETCDGREALDFCQQGVNLLIFDYDLEKISGIQLAQSIFKNGKNKTPKLLAMIDVPDKHVIWGYMVNGISGIIQKSRSRDEIIDAIHRVNDGEIVLDQPIFKVILDSMRQIKPELTDKEITILKYLAIGLRSDQISQKLSISPGTMRSYLQILKLKLPFVRDQVDIILWAWVNLDQNELLTLNTIDQNNF
ncbi:MAG: response regulator transcription factor [Ardenticatenaceae bacterium]|nr:response regulator transcription factor [Ardenticatenaceae bacterium]